MMLQQTQVDRVIPKFLEFMNRFPTIEVLASSSLSDVLIAWSGLGYNRRAKFLHETAKKMVHERKGVFPSDQKSLTLYPGIGPNTAGAILVYGFNQPEVFIETNVRTVYFTHYFDLQETVSDKELLPLIRETMDREHPREWYWALMDYGSFLKRQGAGMINKSRHYKKQAPLEGSVRQVRGGILKQLQEEAMSEQALEALVPQDERFTLALSGLLKDGLVEETDGVLHLAR